MIFQVLCTKVKKNDNRKSVLAYIKFIAVVLLLGISQTVFAIPEPAPGPNTITQYCSSGVCSTGGNTAMPTAQPKELQYQIITSNMIGVQESQACLKLIEHNATSSCLTYKNLKVFDNTNPLLSGAWIEKPWFHRGLPRVANHFTFDNKTYQVMVDPNADFAIRSKLIVIQGDSFTYTNPLDVSKNNIRLQYHNRYVDPSCGSAMVAPNMTLINDTIHYLESGCKTTSYNATQVISMVSTPFDFAHSIWLHYYAWSQNAKTLTKYCITNCTSPHDPFENSAYWSVPTVKHHR